MWMFFRSGPVVAMGLILYSSVFAIKLQARAQQKPPWTKDQIIRMLKGDMSPKRVETLARERGIDFQITPDAESELRQAGASDELLATLQELAPKPSNPKVPISPPKLILPTMSPNLPWPKIRLKFMSRLCPTPRFISTTYSKAKPARKAVW